MKDHPLFKGTPANTFFYYVHSYYAEIGPETIATSEYIVPFSAAIHKKNFYAIQAHPEKSGRDGQIVLQNFLNL
jgi:glutamine amidotransferase